MGSGDVFHIHLHCCEAGVSSLCVLAEVLMIRFCKCGVQVCNQLFMPPNCRLRLHLGLFPRESLHLFILHAMLLCVCCCSEP